MIYSDHKRETHLNSGHVFHIDWNIFVDSTASKRWKYGLMKKFFYVCN